MSNKPLDELYFVWLYSHIANPRVRNSSRSYWKLARQLYTKEYVWIVPNDDNRVEDGRELRYEFLKDEDITDVNVYWMDLGCSVLEMLLGLSRRLSFETGREPRDWFWHLCENINLHKCHDRSGFCADTVDEILEQVIWRRYDRTGAGGLFPLQKCPIDQRKEELWYSMSHYLLEHR